MMFYPRWMPVSNSRTAVEHSVYTIKVPSGFKFRYKEYNGVPPVVKSTDAAGAEIHLWKMDDKPASKPDSYALHPFDFSPMVLASPSDFEIQDYKGNFNSWEDLSKFYYTLNAGRDVLPPATNAEIKALVKDAKTDREKVLLIYKWMQARSRYVSIQLGIGGWQTIDATTVANKGYGDCKALTNFTLAALRQAGITCYGALIKAGDEAKIKPDFPSSQFNHVIACAIVAKDTMWLECTSQTTQANFMGTFTGGRYALLVMPEGGKLVATPGYKPSQNMRKRNSQVKLETTGDGQIEVQTLYTGVRQESRNSILYNSTKEAQKKWLISHVNLPSLELQRFELTEGKGTDPSVTEKLSMNVRSCATKTGTRLFVKPGLLSVPFEMPAATERTTDFYLSLSDYDFTDLDSVSYTIPQGYKLETTLPSFQINSVFGVYESKTIFKDNQLLCSRKVILNGGRYPSKDYTAWIDFLKKIRKADRAQIVFVENKE
ncbi:transglutaminase-like domain-containing protein [Dyadobacter sp. NIV53]|uniref:transglutaminase-like domain-containing protein n=1 Tax=Dyadobacter sp. NIV53 TaxID=2861765 RepID=UPI001C879AE6|nr:transglutaminase-like domain-containing protein [Dyadobacter sp. NIV53]